MSDDYEMRLRLQKVAAYRELCRGVRRSGRENVVFAAIMLFLAYLVSENGGAPPLVLTIYVILAGGELLVGLFKWLVASAEGILLDGLVLLVFAGFNLYMQYVRLQNNWPLDPVIVFLGLFLLMGAVKQFRAYGQLRRLFADRPSAEHMAWVDGLVHEILTADPQSDELALDLPTGPHWKAKLLGKTVFFVARRGGAIWIAGPDDFELLREKADHGTGKRKALLRIHGVPYPDFEITDASWSNYQKWRITNPFPVIAPAPAS
jgi:hypothetical protein